MEIVEHSLKTLILCQLRTWQQKKKGKSETRETVFEMVTKQLCQFLEMWSANRIVCGLRVLIRHGLVSVG